MESLQSNQLSIPFRRSTQLSLSTALCQYVTEKYGQHPDAFRDDLDVIDALRRDAINVREAHSSGIKKLQAYAAQLAWIGGKFPVEIGAGFTWYPALGYNVERPVVQDNLKFEKINILYNLAALYCQLAASTSHADPDGLKTAASYYSQAAGVLKNIREVLLPDANLDGKGQLLPDDLDAATLETLEDLMLAQAQECFWLRAVSERYKDATIAKLAARVSDLYGNASDAAVRSDAISRAWIHHMTAKNFHFAAAAQYRASLDCLEKRRYGEEVARLQDALLCATDGLKESRGGNLSRPVQEDLQNLKRRVEEDLRRAEKDNDMIYLDIVPAKSELKKLDRANMAVARVPPQVENPLEYVGNGADFGPALFAKLVPFAVHLAVSVYEERRDRLVNQNIIHDLEVLTEQLHSTLLALNLPGALQAAERPLGLPGTLKQHAEEIRYADVLSRVPRSFSDIDKLRTSDQALLDEGRALLEAEKDEDMQLRQKYGTDRWTRPESQVETQGQKLWSSAAEIEGYLASSGSSDSVVRDMFASVRDTLALLAGPDRGLLDFVPNSRADVGSGSGSEAVRPALGRLRSAYGDVLRLESRRRKRVEALHDKARADDIKPDMLRETARLERANPHTTLVAAHFDSFFAARLRDRYDEDAELVEREGADQGRALEAVTRASREFEAQRRSSQSSSIREREAALQTLDTAYYKYKEVVKNVEVARKFYNDLSKIAGSFRDQCRTWVQQRRTEAQDLEEELSMPVLSSLSISQRPVAQEPSPPQSSIQSWATGRSQQQTWSPNMGIQFGTPATRAPGPQQPAGSRPSGTWDPSSGIRFG